MNGVDGEGVWPLLAAVRCRQEAMARLLVDQGAHSQRDTTRLCNELHVLADIQKGGPFPTPVTLRPLPGMCCEGRGGVEADGRFVLAVSIAGERCALGDAIQRVVVGVAHPAARHPLVATPAGRRC